MIKPTRLPHVLRRATAIVAVGAVLLAAIVVINRDNSGEAGLSALPGATGQPPTGPTGGGGSGGDMGGPPFPMQPPAMPDAPSAYNSGFYPAPDQSWGIDIYQTGAQAPNGSRGGYNQAPGYQQSQSLQPANGSQPPDYDAPLQTQPVPRASSAPQQQLPTRQAQPSQQPSAQPQQPDSQQQGLQQLQQKCEQITSSLGITEHPVVMPASHPEGSAQSPGRDVNGGVGTCTACVQQMGPTQTGAPQQQPGRPPQPIRLPQFFPEPEDAESNTSVDERVCDPADKTSACRGPVSVCLVQPNNTAPPDIEAERQEYIDLGNDLVRRNASQGADVVRRSTSDMGSRRRQDVNRARNDAEADTARLDIPNGFADESKAAGHMPDLTWGGLGDDYRPVLPMDKSLNSSIGGQAAKYPPGYTVTQFTKGIWAQSGNGKYFCQAAGG